MSAFKFFLSVLILGISIFPINRPAFAAIELQPHQKSSVDYLLSHPEQKGLLLYHSLGSGKTYVALAYAEKKPQDSVIILLPEFLKGNWLTQMKSFGVKNPSRYEMVSLEEADLLLKRDLSKTTVIVDEVHKLILRIRTSPLESEKYIQVYDKLKTAQKLILLTGTPIFTDTSDISFIANLLEEGDPYPLETAQFRTEYMRVKPVTSLTRGYLTESKLMMMAVPFFLTFSAVVTLGTTAPLLVPFVALGGSAVIPVINEFSPPGQIAFREFNAEKWSTFAKKYISYYRVQLAKNENYPDKKVTEHPIPYNEFQTNFFLDFADENLNSSQLKTMLADEPIQLSDSVLRIHSTKLQKQLLGNLSAGREIGNLEWSKENKDVVESPKFLEILALLKTKPGQVAVYSNFWKNGIQRFAQFLDRNGFKSQYQILSPDQSTDEQMKLVEKYNQAQLRILLIHPEITEGISLKGTEQFHILEPIRNLTLQDQIIGRAIRYQSHLHLPQERRRVEVHLWESTVNYSKVGIPTSAGLVRREHWQKKYPEVNPSMWSKGIVEIDGNYFLKDETPDTRVKRRNQSVQNDVESLGKLLEEFSIEST